MESNTIENGSTYILGCSHTLSHEPHKWREGFLWLRKRSCDGLSKEMSDRIRNPPKPPHKHMLRLHMYPEYPFVNPEKVVGHCSGCGTWCSIDKDGFYDILLGRPEMYKIEEEDCGAIGR
ncbi:hypothetical protein SEA_MAKAI_74 [Arthrobacter phage Makai]|nr:hypothetical protein SEA_MAKAI_74 [Arthrobacter phage Makai]QPX62536.1 hypothetical protein SEA_TRUCKEE_72 [Arthrobacter phage Truckee]